MLRVEYHAAREVEIVAKWIFDEYTLNLSQKLEYS